MMTSNIKIRKYCGHFRLVVEDQEFDLTQGELLRLLEEVKSHCPGVDDDEREQIYKEVCKEVYNDAYCEGHEDGLAEAVDRINRY